MPEEVVVEKLSHYFLAMYQFFIKSGAPMEVNLPFLIKSHVETQVCQGIFVYSVFDEVYKHVIELIRDNVLADFLEQRPQFIRSSVTPSVKSPRNSSSHSHEHAHIQSKGFVPSFSQNEIPNSPPERSLSIVPE